MKHPPRPRSPQRPRTSGPRAGAGAGQGAPRAQSGSGGKGESSANTSAQSGRPPSSTGKKAASAGSGPRRPRPPRGSAQGQEVRSARAGSAPQTSPSASKEVAPAASAPARREDDHRPVRRSPFQALRRPVGGDTGAAEILGPGEGASTANLEQRLGERRKARLRLTLGRIFALIATLAVIAAVVWVAYFSPVFALSQDSIRVNGADEKALPSAEVSSAISPWVGTPLLQLDTTAMEGEVKKILLVKQATVTRTWPNGVSVDIVVRTPAMSMDTGSGWAIMDEAGVQLSKADAPMSGAPVVTLPEGEERAPSAGEIMEVWNHLDPAIRSQVTSITSDGHSMTLALGNGATVKWGQAGETALKSKVLTVLLAEREAKIYDLSAPANPVTS
ncbi:MAG: FtsQ-type POTRA domain-containing protein [Actinomycetaceae bacterium]|nr:FtsQ-type POTRA domain-containing protein [Actinomycetaceae bacterium]